MKTGRGTSPRPLFRLNSVDRTLALVYNAGMPKRMTIRVWVRGVRGTLTREDGYWRLYTRSPFRPLPYRWWTYHQAIAWIHSQNAKQGTYDER